MAVTATGKHLFIMYNAAKCNRGYFMVWHQYISIMNFVVLLAPKAS